MVGTDFDVSYMKAGSALHLAAYATYTLPAISYILQLHRFTVTLGKHF